MGKLVNIFSEFILFWIKAVVVQCLFVVCNKSHFFSLAIGIFMKRCPLSVWFLRLFPFIAVVAIIVIAIKFPDKDAVNCGVAFATLYAALVALWKDEYKDYSQRPVLEIGLSNRYTQLNGQIWRRIEICNKGKGIAKNVSIKISCDDPKFVPVRLTWTHINVPLQNIEPNDYALCDVLRLHEQGFCLCTEIAPYDGYTSFGLVEKEFKLTISADNFTGVEKELKIKLREGRFLLELCG
ncbi:MAG: hypothetical protein IJ912_03710 [Fibrobacter sp.]|nr:hypothetical protein [Fibrobacter sp.]